MTHVVEEDKIYGLIVWDYDEETEGHYLKPKERYSEHYPRPITIQHVFSRLLEDYLLVREGQCSFPTMSSSKWELIKANSDEDVENGVYEVLETFTAHDKDGWWKCVEWIQNGACAVIRIMTDY